MIDSIEQESLVSIIMPAFNCGDFIDKTLDSVIDQTYQNWEVIVVDDCSNDNTAQVVFDYIKSDDRIKYHRLEKNSGAAVARNKAVEIASGKYLAFLDSDDLWFPMKLTRQIGFMKDNNYKFTCTSYTKIDESGTSLGRTILAKSKSDYDGLLKSCPGNSTVIYDAEDLGKFLIPDIRKRNDYVMWLMIIKKVDFLHGLIEPLGSHRIRADGISHNKTKLVSYHWRIYRDIEKLSLLKSSYLVLYWVVATVFKLR